MRIAVIAITRNGAALGQKLRENLTGAELFVLRKYQGTSGRNAHTFDDLGILIESTWRDYRAFIFIMATGIVVRMIAPFLESKERDPAVIVMDDTGKFSISLLSGHLGGANDLAERCAFICGSRAVITTATDANDLPSFDMLAKEHDWEIDDLSKVKTLNALLLDGKEIAVVDPGGKTRSYFHSRGRLSFFETFAEALESPAKGYLFVTNRRLPPHSMPKSLLILRPKNLVLGIGCNSGTPADEIESFVDHHLKHIFLSLKSVACIGTAEAKRNEAGLTVFATKYDIRQRYYTSEELNSVTAPSPPSRHALAAIGAIGVAEPAAILASGGGRLLLKKVKSENVTLAVAEITAEQVGLTG